MTQKYHAYSSANVETIPQIKHLTLKQRVAIQAVASVLPFKVNSYIIDQLIDWDNIPDDPIYQLTFPQEGMLDPKDFSKIYSLQLQKAPADVMKEAANKIRLKLNPHPAGQMEMNVPQLNGVPQLGMQHKYRETLLFFPSQGQTCHAYCTYCFRWPQFVGMDGLKFANNEASSLVKYLKSHPEVKDVLITGGDPMVMRTHILRRYIEPLLKIETLNTIRIGTKALAWWPYRFVSDHDANDLLQLFEEVNESGKSLALMAHFTHPVELSTDIVLKAVKRIQNTGTVIRSQAPLVKHVNDSSKAWASMWQTQGKLGIVPYYMFVERDTGAKRYFEVPLFKAYEIYSEALRRVSGLGRTVRGPSMSTTPGKVLVVGVAKISRKKVFVLKLIQGRDPDWANRVFFAKYNEKAYWLNDLKPAFEDKFFFEDPLEALKREPHKRSWTMDKKSTRSQMFPTE